MGLKSSWAMLLLLAALPGCVVEPGCDNEGPFAGTWPLKVTGMDEARHLMPGEGTAVCPFRLANVAVTGVAGFVVEIHDVAGFVVFENWTLDAPSAGFYFDNVSDVTLRDVRSEGGGAGVRNYCHEVNYAAQTYLDDGGRPMEASLGALVDAHGIGRLRLANVSVEAFVGLPMHVRRTGIVEFSNVTLQSTLESICMVSVERVTLRDIRVANVAPNGAGGVLIATWFPDGYPTGWPRLPSLARLDLQRMDLDGVSFMAFDDGADPDARMYIRDLRMTGRPDQLNRLGLTSGGRVAIEGLDTTQVNAAANLVGEVGIDLRDARFGHSSGCLSLQGAVEHHVSNATFSRCGRGIFGDSLLLSIENSVFTENDWGISDLKFIEGRGLLFENNEVALQIFGSRSYVKQSTFTGNNNTLASASDSMGRQQMAEQSVCDDTCHPMRANMVFENNYWGCAGGPDSPACDQMTQVSPGSFVADFDPWLTEPPVNAGAVR